MEFNATFLVSAISFILFTLIMNRIFYAPLTKIMTERQNFIDETYNEAQKSKETAEKLLSERSEKLEQSSLESKQLMNKKVEDAGKKSKDLTIKAKKKYGETISEAKSSLQEENEKNMADLDDKILDLAKDIADRILS